jgi:hypothetical protein
MRNVRGKETQMNNSENLATVVYTPEPQMRTPIRLFQSMWHDFKASRELA